MSGRPNKFSILNLVQIQMFIRISRRSIPEDMNPYKTKNGLKGEILKFHFQITGRSEKTACLADLREIAMMICRRLGKMENL